MNPALILTIGGTTKKQIYFVLATMAVIVSLPVMAVFSLGQKTLSILSFGSGSSESQGLYQGSLFASDTYVWGNCTYWVALLRYQAGNPIPNTWGNAATWALYARLDGYTVDQKPAVGAIMQTALAAGGLGHVAYIQSVDAKTGTWTVSEMNVLGLDIVDTKTYQAPAAQGFNFIHDRLARL